MTRKRKRIGKYDVIRPIGEGGMGTVYHCFDPDLKRLVAIKVLTLRRSPKTMETLRKRFMREALTTAQLQHPGIPPVYDMGQLENGRVYYVMKYIDGVSLEIILERLRDEDDATREEFDLFRLIEVLRDVCQAIQFAHSRGYIHRDLKPSNIFVGDYGEVYVIDWGLTKIIRGDEPDGVESERFAAADLPAFPESIAADGQGAITRTLTLEEARRLKSARKGVPLNSTRTSPLTEYLPDDDDEIDMARTLTLQGNILGTIQYMAPEQALGKIRKVGREVDVYALGVLLYEMLTLELPIQGEDFNQILARKIDGPIDAPEFRAPGKEVPPELSAITMQAMNPIPSERFKSAGEFNNALEYWLEGKSQYRQANRKTLRMDDFVSLPGEGERAWTLQDGVLRGGEPVGDKPNYLLYKKEFIGDVRFRLRFIPYPLDDQRGEVSEFAIVLNADIPTPWTGFVDGYAVHLGAGRNMRAFISRNEVELTSHENLMLEPGRSYALEVTREGDAFKVSLEGQVILFCKERGLPPGTRFGFLNLGPNAAFFDVRIKTKGFPTVVSVLDAPEALMAEKCYEGALKRFLAISQAHRNRYEGAWACYRAGVASFRMDGNRKKAQGIWAALKNGPYALFEKLGRVSVELEDDHPERAIRVIQHVLSRSGPLPHLEPLAEIVFTQALQNLRDTTKNEEDWKRTDQWVRLALKIGRRLDDKQSMTPSILWRWLLLALTQFPDHLSNCILFLRRTFGEGQGAFAEILTTIEPLMTILKRSADMSDHVFLVSKVMRLILNHDDNLGNLETLVRFYLHSRHVDIAHRISTHINKLCQKNGLRIPPAPIAFLATLAWLRNGDDARNLIQTMMFRSYEWAKSDGRLLLGLDHYRNGKVDKAEEHWRQVIDDPVAVSFNRHLVAKGLLGELPSDPVDANVPNRSDHRTLYCLMIGWKHAIDWDGEGDEEAKETATALLSKALEIMRPSYDIYSATNLFATIPLERLGASTGELEKPPEPISRKEEEWLRELTLAASEEPVAERQKRSSASSKGKAWNS